MPRRLAAVTPGIPRFLVDCIVRRELKATGEAPVRRVVTLAKGHLYEIRVRTTSICRRLHPPVSQAGIPDFFEVPV